MTALGEDGGEGGDIRAVTSGISGVDGGGGVGISPRDTAAGKQESARVLCEFFCVD